MYGIDQKKGEKFYVSISDRASYTIQYDVFTDNNCNIKKLAIYKIQKPNDHDPLAKTFESSCRHHSGKAAFDKHVNENVNLDKGRFGRSVRTILRYQNSKTDGEKFQVLVSDEYGHVIYSVATNNECKTEDIKEIETE